jgi:hypothetical protein
MAGEIAPLCRDPRMGAVGRKPEPVQKKGNSLSPSFTLTYYPLNNYQDLSWKAQVRLCQRYRRLTARGKHANQGVVAIARELMGFMWAIAKEVPVAR